VELVQGGGGVVFSDEVFVGDYVWVVKVVGDLEFVEHRKTFLDSVFFVVKNAAVFVD
jgi:hypothetical protein